MPILLNLLRWYLDWKYGVSYLLTRSMSYGYPGGHWQFYIVRV